VNEIGARLSELALSGLEQRTRLVSGPQGPHVVLDGRPVLMLCSNNYLGLSDHPRMREAAADAAMRWGVGAGSSRTVAGTMTIHRRLEERLSEFVGQQAAIVFGAGLEASTGVIGALAGPGDVVFSDEFNHPSIADGCLLSGAETFVYEHLDLEHLVWGIKNVEGRRALIVSESVFGANGDLAPLSDLAYLAERHRVRLMIDEAHGLGTTGPGGRGAVAAAGLETEVDLLVGSLDNALGSAGAFVACDEETARYLRSASRAFIFFTAPPPPALAGALAALELLGERPELVRKLQANAAALRRELDRAGVEATGYETHILALTLGDPGCAIRSAAAALQQGVFVHAFTPPVVSASASGLRLSVMASHRPEELRAAGRSLGQIVRRLAPQAPRLDDYPDEHDMLDFEEARPRSARIFDLDEPAPRSAGIFDLEADDRLAA
jgi:glycine C-acetyltransferase/8-amino-7-oxononanoate synthase